MEVETRDKDEEVGVGVDVRLEVSACDGVDFSVDDVACFVEVECVVCDVPLNPPPPPAKSHDPTITPMLSAAKKSKSAFDMSSAPYGQPGHCWL